MDGNGRWAKNRNLSRIEGHREGAKTVNKIIEASRKHNIKYLTLYAFSTENWKRSKEEILGLMSLLKEFLDSNLNKLIENQIKLRVIGRIDDLPLITKLSLKKAIATTSNFEERMLILALSYGGRSEIVDAVNKIIKDVGTGYIDKNQKITEEIFKNYLYAPDIPDPELMIRTSGEFRISNFMLWQLSYSEIWITDTLWPDFTEDEFSKAIENYYLRNRRYGAV